MARPSLTADQVAASRSRLARLALELYRLEGYEAVTLRELGVAAGMSHATPYRYFQSKEDLFAEVRAEAYKLFAAQLHRPARTRGDPLTRLRKVVRGFAEFARAAPEDYRLMFSTRQPASPPGSALAVARQQALAPVVALYQQAVDAGQLQGDPNTLAHIAWVSVHGLMSLHVSNQLVNGCELDDLLDPLLDQLLPQPPPPASSRRKRTS